MSYTTTGNKKRTRGSSSAIRNSELASQQFQNRPFPLELPPSAEIKHILLAEDDVDMRELLIWSLLDAGYEVEAAIDGSDLCNRLAKHLLHPDSVPVDLVISDIRMPGFNGLDVITGLRNLKSLPPTILITAFGDEEVHDQAEAIDVIILDKPFEIEVLLAKVGELLGP